MSDAASQAILAPAISQLPVSWYFDEKIFELEKRLLFDAGPGYVGHELMVPEANQYRSLEWLDHSRLLINRDDACYQMSNVCRHRQARSRSTSAGSAPTSKPQAAPPAGATTR